MQWANGEILACRAAQAAGVPYTLGTMAICSIEDVAAAVEKPFWFQLYVMKDRGFARSLVERALAARCSALVLSTVRHCGRVSATAVAQDRKSAIRKPSCGRSGKSPRAVTLFAARRS